MKAKFLILAFALVAFTASAQTIAVKFESAEHCKLVAIKRGWTPTVTVDNEVKPNPETPAKFLTRRLWEEYDNLLELAIKERVKEHLSKAVQDSVTLIRAKGAIIKQ